MASEVKRIIDAIIEKRGEGKPALINAIKTKLILRGLDPDSISRSTADSPELLEKARGIALSFGVKIKPTRGL